MIARILRFDEWPRLERTELPPLLPYISPDNAAMVVVEDGEKVVASMAVLRATHFEGAWIDPDWRGNAGVTRALLRLSRAVPKARGEQFVFGGATDDHMRNLLGRLGGVPMAFEPYVLSIGRSECRQQ